ncbi:MAG: hypothetical protein AAGI91_01740 [Bacteroidota bacterium]
MRRCAFLTTDALDAFVTYDRLLHDPLARRGWQVDEVSWRAEADWDVYEAVVVRSPWDYHAEPEAFFAVLEAIDRSAARLENPLALMRWNARKTYLRDLEARGFPIVPTRWLGRLNAADLPVLYDAFGTDELVVKPVVGANADDTFRLPRGAPSGKALSLFADRACLVQPFVPAVVREGEFSLFYFGDAYSHAILKTPASGDFRVQEEHGSTLRAATPEPALRAVSDAIFASLTPRPLYARTDFVRLDRVSRDGGFALMEVELIEPSLYFPYDAASPERFADAFAERMGD